jgi:glycosyltransferase involved in cell wall biosynthesis
MNISAISLISYDSHYLASSIARYYNYVDEIILGLDESRITWSGNAFAFDEDKLWGELQRIDTDNKISVVEGNFHKSKIAIENDNFERNYLKNHCSNDWILSIDADEQLLNPKDFFNRFCSIASRYADKADFCMTWATPYKIIDDTVLVIANEDSSPFLGENQGVLTHKNNTYTYARWTNLSASGANRIQAPLVALHWSLCRNKEDLHQKIHNIGHSDIVDNDPFYKIWSQVTLDNYTELKNFKTSGMGGGQWPKLFAVPKNQLESYYTQHLGRKV